MIGRFSKLGVYHELFSTRDFYVAMTGAIFAMVCFLIEKYAHASVYYAQAFALISVAVNGLPIIWGAVKGLIEREVNVDELVSLAITASLIQGEYLAAAVISFVMTLGGLIEQVTSESARKAIKSLIHITPQHATIIKNNDEITVSVHEVSVGDVILIKPGERIPVDAVILTGISAVDESSMTGEPLPVEKKEGDALMAGTLNHNGVMKAKTIKVGENTALGKVIRLISEAELHRPEAVRLIDRYARWFTPVILTCAGVTWGITGEISRAVAVLIVGCPCALILAAPTATVAALGRASKAGILVKGGRYLEKASGVKAVLFDKTGTLTLGEPRVDDIVCVEGVDKSEVISFAASAEQHLTHPLAKAVIKAAHYAKVVVESAENTFHEIGLGVKAMVKGSLIEVSSVSLKDNSAALPGYLHDHARLSLEKGATPLVVYRNQMPLGLLSVTDKVRPVANAAILKFRDLDIQNMAVISGDHHAAVKRIADLVGINQIFSQMKPSDKVGIIKKFQNNDLPVMFVGDGINDGPALATADVGVAMGAAGTDVALETADIALTHDDISKLPWLIRLSRRMLMIIKVNIVFGLAFNTLAVLASGMGWLSPVMASIVHNVGSVLVVIASASLAVFPDDVC